jgi:hypothetical protein
MSSPDLAIPDPQHPDPADFYVWDASSTGRTVRGVTGVTDQPMLARLRLVAAMLSMPDDGAYGLIRSARLDPTSGPPRYAYGPVLIRVKRGTAAKIEVVDG